MKKGLSLLLLTAMLLTVLCACGTEDTAQTQAVSTTETVAETTQSAVASLEDGVYSVAFDTDSSMFRANEACDGKGTLTVRDGRMILHVSMPSKNIVNLFPGKAEDARKDGAEVLQPTLDTVTYSDGYTEEVNGFDIPVPALDKDFDLALLGKKGKWYDHVVSVSNPEPIE